MSTQKYLVAVDGSEWSERAAAYAVRQAKQTQASVVFLTIVAWSGFQPMTLEDVAHRPLGKKEEETTAHTTILDPLVEQYKDSGVSIQTEAHWGDPSDMIHKRAKKLKVNQIFIGRRGRSRVADLMLGSVANKVAHRAGVPITLVP